MRKIKPDALAGAPRVESSRISPTCTVSAAGSVVAGIVFALASTPALAVDSDGDGVDDNLDNCITLANAGQQDTDADGFGNRCDSDFNGNGITDPADFSVIKAALGTPSPDQDLNSNGIVDPADLSITKSFLGKSPGPSCSELFFGCVAVLDATTIPKYALPLVIPPVMDNNGTAENYDIAVRQFQQQILPGGHWNAISPQCIADPTLCTLPATTVWSYGPDTDPLPDSTGIPGGGPGLAPAPNSQFNYPAYTIETENGGRNEQGEYNNSFTFVNWINDLKDPVTGEFLPHLLPIDQTLHWANPEADCITGAPRTDCMGQNPNYYRGPVPIVTHLHGGHSQPESDGYAEAWYLPDPTGSNFQCTTDPAVAATDPTAFICSGTFVNALGDVTNPGPNGAGVANFTYNNNQPSTTIWYHDHTLGITRNNVYAGPAGFFLIRQPAGGEDGLVSGRLPAPAPVRGQGVVELNVPGDPVRIGIREIPVVIQDRAFNEDGSLFYPADRAFFEGLGEGSGNIAGAFDGNAAAGLDIDFVPSPSSDMPPIWNPEYFDPNHTMVVNGVVWPTLQVAPAEYRFRLLNGTNSRFLNLALIITDPVTGEQTTVNKTVWDDSTQPPTQGSELVNELSFFQIGTEQGILPQVVKVETNGATKLPGDGTIPPTKLAPDPQQALLVGIAERSDVIVDFRGLPNGTVVRMTNTAPDAPFGGFPDTPANPDTTGQVMEFVVNATLNGFSPTDELRSLQDGTLQNPATRATPPQDLVLGPVDNALPPTQIVRTLALLEEESTLVCALVDGVTGEITQVPGDVPPCVTPGAEPFGPLAAVLGTVDQSGVPSVQLWSDPISTNPALGATEVWELQNFSADAHPIHIHLVKFNVLGREAIGGGPSIISATDPSNNGLQEWENGWKDVVIVYPGESASVVSLFDIPGLYVWHCHLVEHEDNEMMVPFCVGDAAACGGLPVASPAQQAEFTTGLTN